MIIVAAVLFGTRSFPRAMRLRTLWGRAHSWPSLTQIEKAPCTVTSDRVCIEAGATMGQDDKIVPPPGYSGSFLPPPK